MHGDSALPTKFVWHERCVFATPMPLPKTKLNSNRKLTTFLLGALLLAPGCVIFEQDEVEETVATDSAGIVVQGVNVKVPFPFTGTWLNNRRTELPLGLKLGALHLPPNEDLNPALAELGNLLFFDKRLSKGAAMSCATCHVPAQGYSSTTFSKGVAGNVLPRTTPPAMNRAFGTENNWIGQRTLEQQSSAPITTAAEMGLTQSQLLAAVSSVPGYVDRFDRLVTSGALSSPAISVTNIERAIATFQRLRLMTGASRVDRFEAGDAAALTAAEKHGRLLFQTKARCALCHSGPNYTDEKFHHIIPVSSGDVGRQAVTGLSSDFGKFKTPSLRNVALRGPYFHNGDPLASSGIATTLDTVVRRYNSGPPFNERNEDPLIVSLGMTSTEQADLVAFLKALTGSIPADPWLSAAGNSTSSPNRERVHLSPAIFDVGFYGATYADLAGKTPAELRAHWIRTGMGEGRQGTAAFSVDEYIQLYRPVYNKVAGLSQVAARIAAFDDFLDNGWAAGRIGRYALHRGFFQVQEYRALNGRSTALLDEEAAIDHLLTVGQRKRLIAAERPTGYFMVGSNAYYADGLAFCAFKNAAEQRTSRGVADDVGVPQLGFVPSNLKNGGACVTSASPPLPTSPASPPNAQIVAFSCQASSSNSGCSKTVTCPAGMTVRSVRGACRLEIGTVSPSAVTATSWGQLRVAQPSTRISDGHCRVDAMDIATGSIGILSPPPVPTQVNVSCSEHDHNGGDCHILGELLCSE